MVATVLFHQIASELSAEISGAAGALVISTPFLIRNGPLEPLVTRRQAARGNFEIEEYAIN